MTNFFIIFGAENGPIMKMVKTSPFLVFILQ